MSEAGLASYSDFSLPSSVVSRIDIARLVAELERVDNEMTTDSIRSKDNQEHEVVKPTLSDQLNDFLTSNQLTLEDERLRSHVIKQMRQLKDHAPVIHMTFATMADRESLASLVSWLRESVHSQAVVAVGMQPSLVAGAYIRTPNHVHDFSMRAKLQENHGKLVGMLEELRG